MAEFSLNASTYPVNEQEGSVLICVESLLQLNITISLDLTLEPGSASTSDFNSTSLTYTFPSGSPEGAVECEGVGITMDDIVEDTEEFSVFLAVDRQDILTNVTQGTAVVVISDSLVNSKSMLYEWLFSAS